MAITARCPNCKQAHTLSDTFAGKTVRCKSCKKPFRIPSAKLPAKTGTKPAAKSSQEPLPLSANLKKITKHLEKRIGPVANIIPLTDSRSVPLELLIVPPTGEAASDKHPLGVNHFTIATSGLSAVTMNVPAEEQAPANAELMIALPSDWPAIRPDGKLDRKAMQDPRYAWPIHWLRKIARMPHRQKQFLAPGLIIPNGEKCDTFAANTRLGAMLVFPSTLSHRATHLQLTLEQGIEFYALYPLYPEEMDYKLTNGIDALLNLFLDKEVTELIDPDRPSIV